MMLSKFVITSHLLGLAQARPLTTFSTLKPQSRHAINITAPPTPTPPTLYERKEPEWTTILFEALGVIMAATIIGFEIAKCVHRKRTRGAQATWSMDTQGPETRAGK